MNVYDCIDAMFDNEEDRKSKVNLGMENTTLLITDKLKIKKDREFEKVLLEYLERYRDSLTQLGPITGQLALESWEHAEFGLENYDEINKLLKDLKPISVSMRSVKPLQDRVIRSLARYNNQETIRLEKLEEYRKFLRFISISDGYIKELPDLMKNVKTYMVKYGENAYTEKAMNEFKYIVPDIVKMYYRNNAIINTRFTPRIIISDDGGELPMLPVDKKWV